MQVKGLHWPHEVDAGRSGCCTFVLYSVLFGSVLVDREVVGVATHDEGSCSLPRA